MPCGTYPNSIRTILDSRGEEITDERRLSTRPDRPSNTTSRTEPPENNVTNRIPTPEPREFRAGRVAHDKARMNNIKAMRQWLADEMDKPGLMNLKPCDNIKRRINNATPTTGKVYWKAQMQVYLLCHAIRVKIGVPEFLEFMTNYDVTNEKARDLMDWWVDHEKEDRLRERYLERWREAR